MQTFLIRIFYFAFFHNLNFTFICHLQQEVLVSVNHCTLTLSA